MKSISEAYILKLQEQKVTDELGIIKVTYALAVIKNELIKTLLLLLIFALLGQAKTFLIVMLLILPIRISTGGVHFQKSIPCFLFSLTYFFLSIFVFPLLKLQQLSCYCLLAISSIIICICPLAPSEARPILSRKKYLQNKYFSIIYLCIFNVIVLVVLKDNLIITISCWALFLHSVELLFLKLHKQLKKENRYV
ncbi:MAG: accessory gene regulator B family protein [Aminipila sp.]